MKYVLITGVSSGIGHYLTELLSGQNYTIIGSYRNLQALNPTFIKHPQIHLVQMDVTNEDSIIKAFVQINSIVSPHGLYAVINNAGVAIPGPLTELPIERIRQQYEVNVFGPIKIIQQAFDLLKQYGPGSRILNMSSVSGLFAAPFLGAYASSKFALEGLSDSLRRELKLLGIKVILIEPGPIKTLIWKKNLGFNKDFKDSSFAQYLEYADDLISKMETSADQLNCLKKPVLDALNAQNPKSRYLIHKNKILFYLLTKYLPVPLVDFLVQRNLKSSNRKIRPI